MTRDATFTFIDLFAGIGGFRRAATANGGRGLGFSEIEADAIAAYEANYPESRETNYGDITKIRSLPPHDFLTGGADGRTDGTDAPPEAPEDGCGVGSRPRHAAGCRQGR